MTADPFATPEDIIAAKQEYLIPCVYHFYRNPPQMVRGEGVYLVDHEGKRYLDLYSGVSVNALGHCHPELVQVICEQVRTLQHTTTIYLTAPLVMLARALAMVLPGQISKSFFCASGSEAVEGAALLATLHTGRSGFLAFAKGLHGRTKLGMSLTGLDFWRTDPNPVDGITHVPAPHCGRCPVSRKFPQCDCACLELVGQALESEPAKPAAMVVEPILGNGGIIDPPAEYFSRLRQFLHEQNILLIADETQTGFGRTGSMFASDQWQAPPDIIAGGKALGGGTPIGFFATTPGIAASYTRPGASTFGGNPVTARAGIKFLEILQHEGLVTRARELGEMAHWQLTQLARGLDCITEVRGRGLMLGLELGSAAGLEPPALTDEVLERMKDRGYLLGKTGPGRNVLTLMPPLIISTAQLQEALAALENCLRGLHACTR